MSAFDKAKKRFVGKIKKLEAQLQETSENYESQVIIIMGFVFLFVNLYLKADNGLLNL